MGWQEIKAEYANKNRLVTQSKADKITRKLLHGMGLVEKQLGVVESSMFSARKVDTPLWDRFVDLCITKWTSNIHTVAYAKLFHFELATHKLPEIMEKMGYVNVNGPWPVFCCYDDAIEEAVVYFPVSSFGLVNTIDPPFKAITRLKETQLYIIKQYAKQFTTQFGPYDWGNIGDE